MNYFDLNELSDDAYVGGVFARINSLSTEGYRDIIVKENGATEFRMGDSFSTTEFFPDDYYRVYFKAAGKQVDVNNLDREMELKGYLKYVDPATAHLEGFDYYEKGVLHAEENGTNGEPVYEYIFSNNEPIEGKMGFDDKRTIVFQMDGMELILRMPKPLSNKFQYEIKGLPEAE